MPVGIYKKPTYKIFNERDKTNRFVIKGIDPLLGDRDVLSIISWRFSASFSSDKKECPMREALYQIVSTASKSLSQ